MLPPSLQSLTQLLANTGWLIGGELVAKASRVITIIALAATLSAAEYGVVMLALVCHEVLRMMLRSGAGAQVVQCSAEDLSQIAGNAYWLQWLFCLALLTLQILLALPIGAFYQSDTVTELLVLMALAYALYPLVSLRVFLLQREDRMREFSIRNSFCIIAENFTVAFAALVGADIYAIVFGKLAFVSVWLFAFSRVKVAKVSATFDWRVFKGLLGSSFQLVGAELSRSLRQHADIFIAGRMLSPELFGLYSFAKSAGVGLTYSLSQAFTAAIYPYLCRENRQGKGLQHVYRIYPLATLVGCLFCLQALAVPLYVPLVFGDKWQYTHATTALLCVAALPSIWIDTLCVYQRALANYKQEAQIRLFCLLASVFVVLADRPDTPASFAIAVLFGSVSWLLCFIPVLTKPISPYQSGKNFSFSLGKNNFVKSHLVKTQFVKPKPRSVL